MDANEADVSYLAAESWDERMPERLRWLREQDPVHWSEKDQLWVLSRYEDVVFASKHQEIFTSAEGVRPGNGIRIGLIDEPEPRHGQLRSLLHRGFTPRMVKKLEVAFEAIVGRAIDRVARLGECDFVADIAVPLPLQMIAAMIGIREQDWDRFHRWSDDMILADGRENQPEVIQRATAAYMDYAGYVTEIIEERRREPRDDLVSILAGAKDGGLLREFDEPSELFDPGSGSGDMSLANDELIKMMVILLVAGNETTRNAISGGMQLLIENRGERKKLLDDPSLIPMAVEEMVRVVSPVHSFSRTLVCDYELHDAHLAKGERILMIYPSANRDESVFPEADSFRVDRNASHVGFGIGSHFCLGANLARMEMRVAFRELLRRLPDMEYSEGGPVIEPAALVRACTRMAVRFTPEA